METTSMFDLVLRGSEKLDEVLRDQTRIARAAQRLLLLALAGLCLHGLVVGLFAATLPTGAVDAFFLRGRPWLWMPLAFGGAFMGTICLCLPSFWFYTQLSGLDASLRLIAAQSLRAQATTSVLLMGFLPLYASYALLGALGLADSSHVIGWGLGLPFLVGLFGVRALYRAFDSLAHHLPASHQRRGNFLLRMVLAWAAIYTVIAPIAMWRLAEKLGQVL